MLLATYQPFERDEAFENPKFDCFREKLGGEYPVFCVPARTADEFCFRSLLAAPRKPERLCVFETDDFVRFDAVVWSDVLIHGDEERVRGLFDGMFEDVDERFSEYVVKPRALDGAREVDIKELIENGRFSCSSDEGGLADSVVETLDGMRRMALDTAVVNAASAGSNPATHDLEAILYQTAFIHYLGAAVWKGLTGGAVSPIDLCPFSPLPGDLRSLSRWNDFEELRERVIDDGCGSHEEYLAMCKALEDVVSGTRGSFLSRIPRNEPCPCFSGKKMKKCHGAVPVELFPFERSRR